ncbi:MAG: hypothetical protein IPP73_10250 [Chitinophagaceae bacterium]|nr:hypothetical protein [Chitinophagaceae bacterium]
MTTKRNSKKWESTYPIEFIENIGNEKLKTNQDGHTLDDAFGSEDEFGEAELMETIKDEIENILDKIY